MSSLLTDITGVILVGGKSRRMGQDKAMLELNGQPLFERVLDVLQAFFSETILVGDREERFVNYNLPVFQDIYPGSSLGGLYTGLYHAKSEYVFVASCDLAFPNSKILEYLCSLREEYDGVVPKTSLGYEPFYAVYAKNCLVPIKAQLEGGDYCAYSYYQHVRIRQVPLLEFEHLDQDRRAFLNINTPQDYMNAGGRLCP